MATVLKAFSKAELIKKFKAIYAKGWIENYRKGNDGAVGNILEDLLEIPENNLPIPNAAEWELKAQRANTSSLLTMFHTEPSPTALTIIPSQMLPLYGWSHDKAGTTYPKGEKSFRATLNAKQYSDRGFKVHVNDKERKVEVILTACTPTLVTRNGSKASRNVSDIPRTLTSCLIGVSTTSSTRRAQS